MLHRGLALIQTQICLPLIPVRSVTGEAVIRENRPNVAVELDLRLLHARIRIGSEQGQDSEWTTKEW